VFKAIDHVQLAIPAGAQDQALQFWVDLLGFSNHPNSDLPEKVNRV
jgi:4-hydroxyphenylpyruvate dioxygenase-like putative hemolysin